MIALLPFEVYVQGTDGRMYTVTVKSSQPEVGLQLYVAIVGKLGSLMSAQLKGCDPEECNIHIKG